jgi:hypothetical protein
MQGAPYYLDRAARLRELAGVERDVIVRRQLIHLAIRFEEFADELEGKTAGSARTSTA